MADKFTEMCDVCNHVFIGNSIYDAEQQFQDHAREEHPRTSVQHAQHFVAFCRLCERPFLSSISQEIAVTYLQDHLDFAHKKEMEEASGDTI